MASVIRRRYLGGAAAALGSLLAAACGEIEVRYVQGPAGPAGPAGAQGERGATGATGAKGAAGAAGQTQTIVQEKVVTVEKPVIVEKVVTVDRPVVVEKVVEVAAKAAPLRRVVLWTYFWRAGGNMSERGTGFLDLTNQWNAQGTNITMGLEPLSGQGKTNTAKVIASYAAGIPPDLLHSAYWDKGVYGIRDMVVELEGTFIKADKEYAATMDDFYPHLLESSYWQGKLWSLPQETNSNLPYTNLAYVREAGLDTLKLGYTWDDWVEYLKKLQQFLGPGIETGKWAMTGLVQRASGFINLLKENGGEYFNEDRTKVAFNSPEGVEAMQYTADLVHKHQVHAPHPDIIKAAGLENPNFPSGTIAMEWETSAYRVVQWAERIGGLENMYVAPSPTKKQPFIANLGQNTAMFKTSSQQQDAAWQVMRWLTSTEPAAHYAAVTFFLPPRKSVLTTPEYAQNLKDVPQFKTFVDALDYGYRPFHPEFPEIYGTFQSLVSRPSWKELRSVKDDLDEAARVINAKLEDFQQRTS